VGGRGGGVPLYYRVMRALRESIVSGEAAPGERLPTEAALMERFGVSRVVVRQALGILEDDGLIFRVRGKGTYVSLDVEAESSSSHSGYLEDLIRQGLRVEVRVLEFGLSPAPAEVTASLGISTGERVVFAKRLRSVEGEPFAVVESYVPADVGGKLRLGDLEREPLMRLLETKAGVEVTSATEVFQAVAADDETARLLGIDPLAPLLKMTLTAFSKGGRPVNLEYVFFRSDRYHYRAHFRRRRGPGAAVGWVPVEKSG